MQTVDEKATQNLSMVLNDIGLDLGKNHMIRQNGSH